MSARAWARWQASGTHFMICVAIAAAMVTLVVFKAGKPGTKFDLTVIALLQLGALLYGAPSRSSACARTPTSPAHALRLACRAAGSQDCAADENAAGQEDLKRRAK